MQLKLKQLSSALCLQCPRSALSRDKETPQVGFMVSLMHSFSRALGGTFAAGTTAASLLSSETLTPYPAGCSLGMRGDGFTSVFC